MSWLRHNAPIFAALAAVLMAAIAFSTLIGVKRQIDAND